MMRQNQPVRAASAQACLDSKVAATQLFCDCPRRLAAGYIEIVRYGVRCFAIGYLGDQPDSVCVIGHVLNSSCEGMQGIDTAGGNGIMTLDPRRRPAADAPSPSHRAAGNRTPAAALRIAGCGPQCRRA